MKNKTNTSSGLGLGGTLFIVFLILKLTETINWSWWWVTSPLWIPVLLLTCIGIVSGLIYLLIKKKT